MCGAFFEHDYQFNKAQTENKGNNKPQLNQTKKPDLVGVIDEGELKNYLPANRCSLPTVRPGYTFSASSRQIMALLRSSLLIT